MSTIKISTYRVHAHSASENTENGSDAELTMLIKGVIQKNRLDQKKLYEKFYNLIFSVCLRYSNQREEAGSFANLCFLKIFNNLEKYSFQGSFEGWICKLSVHTCLDQIRSRVRYEKKFTLTDVPEETIVGKNIIDDLALADLYKIIQALPDTFQTVFCLHVIEGYKHQEIAELLSISVGTSRWYLSKAKEELKLKLKNYK